MDVNIVPAKGILIRKNCTINTLIIRADISVTLKAVLKV